MKLCEHLNAYCRAFTERNLDGALALFSQHALFEMPLLGQRLFGTGEIAVGLRRIFDVTESAEINFIHAQEDDRVIIAEGSMTAKLHRDDEVVRLPLAITLAVENRLISRLSMYLDARPYRLWTDGPVFASSPSPN
jgi:SnoaL-like domain